MIEKLTKRREPLGLLDAAEERILCDPAQEPNALADLLLRLYREQLWIVCPCGWTFHCRAGHTLARNPGQVEPEAEPCALCLAWPYKRGHGGPRERERRPDEPGLTLIPTGRRRSTGPADAPRRSGSGRLRMKYHSMFKTLWTVMSDCGFLSLGGPLRAAECWRRVHEALSLSPVHPDDPEGLTYADLSWTPESGKTPEETLARVRQEWRIRGVEPQVWIFGVLDQIPRAAGGRLRFRIEGVHHPVEIDLDPTHRNVIGETGPHLVFVQASHDADAGIRCDRLAAQAILSVDCPVPVDSSYERDVVCLVQALGLNFFKPVFSVVENLKPDLMLLDLQILLEVQGMTLEEYLERKERVHERMRSHPAFRGWRLVTYEPALGETLRELKSKLRGWWRVA